MIVGIAFGATGADDNFGCDLPLCVNTTKSISWDKKREKGVSVYWGTTKQNRCGFFISWSGRRCRHNFVLRLIYRVSAKAVFIMPGYHSTGQCLLRDDYLMLKCRIGMLTFEQLVC